MANKPIAMLKLRQVQEDTQQGGLARTIVAHQPKAFSFGDEQFWNAQHDDLFVLFFELRDLYHSSCRKGKDIS